MIIKCCNQIICTEAEYANTFFKRFTAQTFYKLLNKLGGEIVYNHADYRGLWVENHWLKVQDF